MPSAQTIATFRRSVDQWWFCTRQAARIV